MVIINVSFNYLEKNTKIQTNKESELATTMAIYAHIHIY
ncbi:hypothetical protein [Plasmodium yoelii yoelii]|uniref:Uncharacterized protein n=1 Tax=Plasmodium yoelii yoelii TaxID=73239 RepID=Q7R8W1_PLAYO|nr:hypothetical protein [Plasmodium yoelii yoelii]